MPTSAQYTASEIVIWNMDTHCNRRMGFERIIGDEDTDETSHRWVDAIEAAGWHTGEGLTMDNYEFVSLVHASGEPMRIER